MEWNVHDTECWARSLGMSSTALFGLQHQPTLPGKHVVFVDGRAASFAFSIGGADDDLLSGPEPISWTWSSFLRRSLILTTNSTRLFLRMWDAPTDVHTLRVPRSAAEAEALVVKLSTLKAPRAPDVVGRMIVAFKKLRSALSAYNADNLEIVRVFNLLIRIAEQNGVAALTDAATVKDLLSFGHEIGGPSAFDNCAEAPIDEAVDAILLAPPRGVRQLEPHLLIRHASGFLYQEAHFELERHGTQQRTLFGHLEPNLTTRGTRQRDARLTPPELARTMIQESLLWTDAASSELCILDPACGSGVFLQEALRELDDRSYSGSVTLLGYDASPIATEITAFCLEEARRDVAIGNRTEVNISQRDALGGKWDVPDMILMNPPFASYNDMTDESSAKF